MHINIPGGGEKAVQLIPIGDIAQKDEFQRIKEISANDIVIAHGVQPALAGIKPENTGGFGDIGKIEKYYRQNEVRGLVQPFTELNDVLIDMGVAKNKLFNFDFNLNLLDQE
jgi:capsid portal protein